MSIVRFTWRKSLWGRVRFWLATRRLTYLIRGRAIDADALMDMASMLYQAAHDMEAGRLKYESGGLIVHRVPGHGAGLSMSGNIVLRESA